MCVRDSTVNGRSSINAEKHVCLCICFARKLKPNYRRSMVWVGSHKLQKGSARYMAIYSAVLHPQYQAVGNGYVNDIALIKLTKKLTFSDDVRPVSLPSVDDTFGSSSECWITGWGNVEKDGKLYTYSFVHIYDPLEINQLLSILFKALNT